MYDQDRRHRCSVALLCSGIGMLRRGAESFFSEYFQALREHGDPRIDVELFQGGTEYRVAGARRLRRLTRYSRIGRAIGKVRIPHGYGWDRGFWTESLSFLCSFLLVNTFRGPYDIVHVTDSQAKNFLCFFKRRRLLRSRLVFSVGQSYDVLGRGLGKLADQGVLERYHFANLRDYERVLAERSLPPEKVICLPQGVDTALFSAGARAKGENLRKQMGIPTSARIVTSIGVFNRSKNMQTLVEAVAAMSDRPYLVVFGDSADQNLTSLAASLLGNRFVFRRIQQSAIPDFLCVSDVFAFPSVNEGFGRVILEAACSGIPCFVHDDDWFCNIIRDPYFRVDMTDVRALRDRLERSLRDCVKDRARFRPTREDIVCRYDWSKLVPAYLERLYGVRSCATP